MYLRVFVAVALPDKRDPLPIRRPSGLGLPFLAGRELCGAGSIGIDPPDVRDALVGLPVRFGEHVHHLRAIRRELRVADHRQADDVDDGHGPLGKCRSGMQHQHTGSGEKLTERHGETSSREPIELGRV